MIAIIVHRNNIMEVPGVQRQNQDKMRGPKHHAQLRNALRSTGQIWDDFSMEEKFTNPEGHTATNMFFITKHEF